MRYVINTPQGFVHLVGGEERYKSEYTLRPKLKDATAFRTAMRADRRAQGLGFLPGRYTIEVIRR